MFTYENLFKLLEEKHLNKKWLRDNGINPKVVDKLIKNEDLKLSTINKICTLLECKPEDIVTYKPDNIEKENNMIYENTYSILNEIRKIMKENKITIKELSEKLNKSQSATSGLFRMKNISLETLNEIVTAIDYKIEINFIPDHE